MNYNNCAISRCNRGTGIHKVKCMVERSDEKISEKYVLIGVLVVFKGYLMKYNERYIPK